MFPALISGALAYYLGIILNRFFLQQVAWFSTENTVEILLLWLGALGKEVGSAGMLYRLEPLSLNLCWKVAQSWKQEGTECGQLCLRSISMWHLYLDNPRTAPLDERGGPSSPAFSAWKWHRRVFVRSILYAISFTCFVTLPWSQLPIIVHCRYVIQECLKPFLNLFRCPSS